MTHRLLITVDISYHMIHMYLGNVEKVAIGESSNADDDANSSKAGRCNFFKFKVTVTVLTISKGF